MDNALIFLGIALIIAVIGGVVVMFLHRDPEASADGVEEFQRIMSALAPDEAEPAHPESARAESARPASARPASIPADPMRSEGSDDGA